MDCLSKSKSAFLLVSLKLGISVLAQEQKHSLIGWKSTVLYVIICFCSTPSLWVLLVAAKQSPDIQYNQQDLSFQFWRLVQSVKTCISCCCHSCCLDLPSPTLHLLFCSVHFLSTSPSTGDQSCQGQINMWFVQFAICPLGSFRRALPFLL